MAMCRRSGRPAYLQGTHYQDGQRFLSLANNASAALPARSRSRATNRWGSIRRPSRGQIELKVSDSSFVEVGGPRRDTQPAVGSPRLGCDEEVSVHGIPSRLPDHPATPGHLLVTFACFQAPACSFELCPIVHLKVRYRHVGESRRLLRPEVIATTADGPSGPRQYVAPKPSRMCTKPPRGPMRLAGGAVQPPSANSVSKNERASKDESSMSSTISTVSAHVGVVDGNGSVRSKLPTMTEPGGTGRKNGS
jgi:hypothetical protein